jgi:cytochrome c551/c552
MPAMTRFPISFASAVLAAALVVAPCSQAWQRANPKNTATALDKMAAAGKSQREMAQYVFDQHGCTGCHTAGQDGKLGFTEKGKQLSSGFEGCVRSLTAMNLIAQVPENQRSADQKKTAQRFGEFGCTTCHQIIPGKMGLTELGTKLTHLHLGCVEVEKSLASR